jgi:hypothetical protein
MADLPDDDSLPIIRRERPAPRPEDERFVPVLIHPPLDLPKPAPPDPFAPSRARAEHLCLWLACSRVLCRNSRHCHGRAVNCLAEIGEPPRPLLESVGRRTFSEG